MKSLKRVKYNDGFTAVYQYKHVKDGEMYLNMLEVNTNGKDSIKYVVLMYKMFHDIKSIADAENVKTISIHIWCKKLYPTNC